MKVQSSQYSDLNQFRAKNAPLYYGLESIIQSITNILSTPIGSRFFQPTFGSRLPELLFEPMNEDTELLIMNASYTAVQTWEPRVQLSFGNSSVVSDYENHTYHLTLAFKVLGYNDADESLQYFKTTLQKVFK